MKKGQENRNNFAYDNIVKNIAIVTGASSGIGEEFVKQIADKYISSIDEIWIIARRKDRLIELSKKINIDSKYFPLDLSKDDDIRELATALDMYKPNVRILVNSAGFGIKKLFELDSYSNEIGMVNTNCKGLTAVTYVTLPYMKRHSRIINIASTAAFLPQPGFSVYAASKSYVLSFSRALKYELRSRDISVTAVCPGPVDTEFFIVSDKDDIHLSIKNIFMVKPKQVVSKALYDAAHKDELSIYGIPMKIVYALSKILPHKIILNILYRQIK